MLSLVPALKRNTTRTISGLRAALASRSESLIELLQIDLIQQHYLAAGGPAGPLGYPNSAVKFANRQAIREYRGGTVSIQGNGVRGVVTQETTITFLGFKCIRESKTDQMSSADEPYCVITVDSGLGSPVVRTFGRFENVNTGTEIAVGEVLIKGVPPNITGLRVLAFENDFGSPDTTAKEIQAMAVTLSQQAGAFAAGAAAADGPGVGPAAAAGTVGGIAAGPIGAAIAAAAVTALDLKDDFIGQSAKVLFLRPGELGTAPTKGVFRDTPFNHMVSIDGQDNGEYEFYFDVQVLDLQPGKLA